MHFFVLSAISFVIFFTQLGLAQYLIKKSKAIKLYHINGKVTLLHEVIMCVCGVSAVAALSVFDRLEDLLTIVLFLVGIVAFTVIQRLLQVWRVTATLKLWFIGIVSFQTIISLVVSTFIMYFYFLNRANPFLMNFVSMAISISIILMISFQSTRSLVLFLTIVTLYQVLLFFLDPDRDLCSMGCPWKSHVPNMPMGIHVTATAGTSLIRLSSVVVCGIVLKHMRKLDMRFSAKFVRRGFIAVMIAYVVCFMLVWSMDRGIPFLPFASIAVALTLLGEQHRRSIPDIFADTHHSEVLNSPVIPDEPNWEKMFMDDVHESIEFNVRALDHQQAAV
ncbi:hypothetical protein PCE1_001411 [Barthelona sp. PCE]